MGTSVLNGHTAARGALVTVLFLPVALLTLAGGALFGPIWGAFYSLSGVRRSPAARISFGKA
jgi:hypothetical protein